MSNSNGEPQYNNPFQKAVPYYIFAGTMSVFLVAFGWIFVQLGAMQTRVDMGTESRNDIKIQLTKVQTDVEWIRRTMEQRGQPASLSE